MDFEPTPEQDEFRAWVCGWLERDCPIADVRAVAEGDAPDGVWEKASGLGLTGMTVPESAGGLGLGPIELTLACFELGEAVTPGRLFPTLTQYVPALLAAPSSAAAEERLGQVARGELTGTLAVANEAGDWSVDAVMTTAEPDGDGWRLDGRACWVFDAATVDEIILAAREPGTTGDDGVGLFVVPRDALAVTTIENADPTRDLGHVVADGVEVGPGGVVLAPGEEGGGALAGVLDAAAVALAAETVGACQGAFDLTLEHAKVREQFGVPIGSFQAVKHQLADAFVALQKARATVEFGAMAVAENDPRRRVAAAMAKAAAGDCQGVVVRAAIQLHGGIGYTWEHDLHLYVKRAQANAPLLGTARQHRRTIADHALSVL